MEAETNTYDLGYLTTVVEAAMNGGVEVKDRKFHLKKYKQCFLGNEFCDWAVKAQHANDSAQAVLLGQACLQATLLVHTVRDHEFKNEGKFYKFLLGDTSVGHAVKDKSWHEVAEDPNFKDKALNSYELSELLKGKSDLMEKNNKSHIYDMLFDKYNCDMYDNIRPREWVDPETDGNNKYDILVIGGGAAGLVTAAGSAGVGARACLIEKGFLGGDCLVTGCVPSKAFLKAAHIAHSVRTSEEYGINIKGTVTIDFAFMMNRLKKIRSEISQNDAAKRFTDKGVEVYFGEAKFKDKNTVVVNGKELTFLKCCIATGGRPFVPQIPGLDKVKYYNSDNIWNLTELPKKILVVGSGPIGSELGQGFARFGSEVTMLERGNHFLPRDDPDGIKILQEQMKKDGVIQLFETSPKEFAPIKGSDRILVTLQKKDGTVLKPQEFDVILLATGRTPNVESLKLEEAGVKYDRKGITVDKNLLTTNKNIYAAGDCVPGFQFTHNSDIQARSVIRNALFYGKVDYTKIIMPYCTYTDPEISQVGPNEVELNAKGVKFDTYTKHFAHNDRALTESNDGLWKIHTEKGKDKIIGATLVGGPAGDLIVNVTMAMYNNLGLKAMGACVHPYPTYAEGFRNMADDFNRTKLTPTTKGLLRGLIDHHL